MDKIIEYNIPPLFHTTAVLKVIDPSIPKWYNKTGSIATGHNTSIQYKDGKVLYKLEMHPDRDADKDAHKETLFVFDTQVRILDDLQAAKRVQIQH
ncbi:hypothetical protein A0H81_14110 [Grifola frondosa]|uniref:Uncharacterized protein n=1 Tax=Grifola frondosa TaxID=5627 RepID=A0A1C7LSX9_GRIFR|nr:hypothetical protein A0H81_14110 [Grifola frondosa]